jgi:hypothetical protein
MSLGVNILSLAIKLINKLPITAQRKIRITAIDVRKTV